MPKEHQYNHILTIHCSIFLEIKQNHLVEQEDNEMYLHDYEGHELHNDCSHYNF